MPPTSSPFPLLLVEKSVWSNTIYFNDACGTFQCLEIWKSRKRTCGGPQFLGVIANLLGFSRMSRAKWH